MAYPSDIKGQVLKKVRSKYQKKFSPKVMPYKSIYLGGAYR